MKGAEILIFSNFHGLTVAKVSDLRRQLRKDDADYVVAKKTLAQRVLKEEGYDMPKLEGEVAFIFGHGDALTVVKNVVKFAKANDTLKVLGGVFEKRIIDAGMITQLSKIPPREVLLAQVVGIMKAPQQRFVGVLSGNIQKLVRVLQQVSEQKS